MKLFTNEIWKMLEQNTSSLTSLNHTNAFLNTDPLPAINTLKVKIHSEIFMTDVFKYNVAYHWPYLLLCNLLNTVRK